MLKEQYSGSSVDVTEGYRYNERNELTERISAGSLTAYHYDKNGSIISEEKEGRKSEYRYDLLNRQTYVKTLDGKEQENFYDGEGLRAGLTENEKYTIFLFHNREILTERDGESTSVKRYLTGLGLSHVQTEDGAYHAYHQDEQGSTAYITGQGVENCYQYDAFGNLTEKKETITNRIFYTGQQYDQETGQYYLRARYYNPVVGRFLQEDTYRGDGLNLYAYCANNPVMYFDPSGNIEVGYENKDPNGKNTTPAEQVGGEPNVSQNKLKHINNRHNPNSYAQQINNRSEADIVQELENKTFFNKDWSKTQIKDAVNAGYKEAIEKGIVSGQYTSSFNGEKVTIVLENGKVKTAFGDIKYTFDQLLKLLKR